LNHDNWLVETTSSGKHHASGSEPPGQNRSPGWRRPFGVGTLIKTWPGSDSASGCSFMRRCFARWYSYWKTAWLRLCVCDVYITTQNLLK